MPYVWHFLTVLSRQRYIYITSSDPLRRTTTFRSQHRRFRGKQRQPLENSVTFQGNRRYLRRIVVTELTEASSTYLRKSSLFQRPIKWKERKEISVLGNPLKSRFHPSCRENPIVCLSGAWGKCCIAVEQNAAR